MKAKTTITIPAGSATAIIKASDTEWIERLDRCCETMPDDYELIGTVTELGVIVEKRYAVTIESITLVAEEEGER